ncbi:MAG: ABC transporter substrate-binding protein, partial [Chloroflexi bacterium]|nr:ABC transporter substrate-binding protein [Chloroflexota bacterium]
VLASCAPAAPTAPTVPTTPKPPTAPTAPAAPTAPTAPTTPATSATEVPKYGGTLRSMDVNLRGFTPVLLNQTDLWALSFTNDPLYIGDWTKGSAGSKMTDWFLPTNSVARLGPALAESYEIPDPETIIVHLRKGVHYALDPSREASRLVNGREVTADDVAFSINQWFFEPKGYLFQGRVPAESRPKSVTAADKYTIVYKIPPTAKSIIFHQGLSAVSIFPPEVYTKYDKMADWRNVVGMGAFLIQDYIPNSVITYVKNPNYWGTDPIGPGKGQQLPYLDGVKVFIITDKSTQQAALRTAKVDVAPGEPPGKAGFIWEDAKTMLKTTPQLQYAKFITRAPTGIGLRVDKPELPWYNKSVRHALTMAIDYNSIIKSYFGGDAQLVFPISPQFENLQMYTPPEEWPQNIKDIYTYNPDKAKKILADAGYPNGFKVKVLTQQQFVDELSVIKDYWSKIGVDLTLDVRERAVFTSISEGFQHEQAVGQSLTASTPFAFHPYDPPDVSNTARINDKYANELFSKIQADYFFVDETVLGPDMKKFFQYSLEQAWYIQFPGTYVSPMWWPWLKNYHGEDYLGTRGRHAWVKYVWIDQALKKSMGF